MSILPNKPLPSVPSGEKRVSFTVWMDPQLLKAVKHEAIDREMSVAEIIEEALRSRSVPVLTEHK